MCQDKQSGGSEEWRETKKRRIESYEAKDREGGEREERGGDAYNTLTQTLKFYNTHQFYSAYFKCYPKFDMFKGLSFTWSDPGKSDFISASSCPLPLCLSWAWSFPSFYSHPVSKLIRCMTS